MTEEYDLKKSMEALGQLVPCLKDADGRNIDGLHRLDNKPDAWVVTHKHINTPVKRSLARLAVNFCRRQMPPEELRKEIGFLIGASLKVEDIAEQTGISERTIYRHMPEQMKDQKLSQAQKEGKSKVLRQSLTAVKPTVKTYDMPPHPKAAEHPQQCELCPIGTGTWFPYRLRDGRTLCGSCLKKLWDTGEVTMEDLLKEGERPPIKPPEKPRRKAEVKEYKPKETAEFRRARMRPSVSKMELAVLEELHKRGHQVEFQKEICLEKTVVDFIVDGKPVYLDGKRVHRNREWTDSRIRERLAKIMGEPVYAVPYERFSKEKIEQIADSIEEALT